MFCSNFWRRSINGLTRITNHWSSSVEQICLETRLGIESRRLDESPERCYLREVAGTKGPFTQCWFTIFLTIYHSIMWIDNQQLVNQSRGTGLYYQFEHFSGFNVSIKYRRCKKTDYSSNFYLKNGASIIKDIVWYDSLWGRLVNINWYWSHERILWHYSVNKKGKKNHSHPIKYTYYFKIYILE